MGRLTEAQRFWPRVAQGEGGCWVWTGGKRSNGYGTFAVHRNGAWTQTTAHRWSYQDAYGPVDAVTEVDHLCRNRGCVRPEHLEAVTIKENRRRRDEGHPFEMPAPAPIPTVTLPAKRVIVTAQPATHCRKGHEYAVTGWASNGKARTCAGCREDAQARRRKGNAHGTETHCPAGHPYVEGNIYWHRRGTAMHRECRTCVRARSRSAKT